MFVGYVASLVDRMLSKENIEVDENLLFHLQDMKSEEFKPYEYKLEMKRVKSNEQ